MIQFNLLPDVKIQYIKAQRSKKMVLLIASLSSAGLLGITLLIALHVYVAQKVQLSNVDKSIKNYSNELKNTPEVDKILTVQNQLNTLVDLHEKKPVTSRIYDYVPKLTPQNVKIGSLGIDYATNKVTISGTADSLQNVNKYVDTFKFTTYKSDVVTDELPAFKSVVLSSFSKDEKGASYTITADFDPLLFDGTKKITLIIPKKYTTRSITEQPNEALFDGNVGQQKTQTNTTNNGQQASDQ